MSSPLEPGTLLAGKYRIDRVLGQGGMGAVVAAHHLKLDEEVAIKFLLREALSNREAVARFEREARAAVKIKSEHTVRVSDVGTLDTGAPYMVMELLRGRDLAQVLQERGPMPLDEASDYLLQACEAIAEAHGLGMVHRDLKPANLFLTHRADGSPLVKVIDFGISKVTNASGSDGDQGMTRTNAIMGSPLYMSPEQLMSARDVDMRTDVWALGVIFYELLTGTTPFTAETLPQLCTTIMTAPPSPIRSHCPDVPPGVEKLILGCLEKDRGKRVPTVAEFALQLAPHAPKRARLSVERIERMSRAAGFSASALAVPPSSGDAQDKSHTMTEFGKTGPQPASSRWWVAGAAGAVAIGAVAFVALRGEPVPAPEAVLASPSGSSREAQAVALEAPPGMNEKKVEEPKKEEPPREASLVAPPPEPSPSAAPAVPPVVRPPTRVGPGPKPKASATALPPKAAARPPPPEPQSTHVTPKLPKPNCDPNFYFDAQGQKHFKRECF